MLGFAPPLLSNDLSCMKCTINNNVHHLFKVIASTFLAPTIFFVLVSLFRFRATLASLNAFILFSQVVSSPPSVRLVQLFLHANPKYRITKLLVHLILSFYGIWNLDFFVLFLPPFCLPLMNTYNTLLFNMLPTLLILFLSLLMMTWTELHARGFWLLVFLWRPFHRFFVHFRKDWQIGHSVINSFTTILLLSYFKFLVTIFDSVSFTIVRDGGPLKSHDFRLSYQPNHYLFHKSSSSISSIIIAFVVFLIVVVSPCVILLFYPVRCFRWCLHFTCFRSARNRLGLQIFMDSFQGYFKDGSEEGTRDCRCFSGLYLLIRIVLYALYNLKSFFNPFALVILLIFALLIAFIRPYKTQYSAYNIIDPLMLFTLALWYHLFTTISSDVGNQDIYYSLILMVSMLPILYILVQTMKWVSNSAVFIRVKRFFRPGYSQIPIENFVTDESFNRETEYYGATN